MKRWALCLAVILVPIPSLLGAPPATAAQGSPAGEPEMLSASYGIASVSDALLTNTVPGTRNSAAVDVPLVDGWNIVALAAQPSPGFTASTLAADINDQGADVSQVFWWNATAGSWDFYLVDTQYGADFDIKLGEGYLLRSADASIWTIQGN